jgi:hypothetical protein
MQMKNKLVLGLAGGILAASAEVNPDLPHAPAVKTVENAVADMIFGKAAHAGSGDIVCEGKTVEGDPALGGFNLEPSTGPYDLYGVALDPINGRAWRSVDGVPDSTYAPTQLEFSTDKGSTWTVDSSITTLLARSASNLNFVGYDEVGGNILLQDVSNNYIYQVEWPSSATSASTVSYIGDAGGFGGSIDGGYVYAAEWNSAKHATTGYQFLPSKTEVCDSSQSEIAFSVHSGGGQSEVGVIIDGSLNTYVLTNPLGGSSCTATQLLDTSGNVMASGGVAEFLTAEETGTKNYYVFQNPNNAYQLEYCYDDASYDTSVPVVVDSDSDGVPDADDDCPSTGSGKSVDSDGCAKNQIDADGDGSMSDVDCDDNDPTAEIVKTWYEDADGDSYGDNASSLEDCGQPSNYVANNSDCNDNDELSYPGATELEDSQDNDCNGTIDDGFGTEAPDCDDFMSPPATDGSVYGPGDTLCGGEEGDDTLTVEAGSFRIEGDTIVAEEEGTLAYWDGAWDLSIPYSGIDASTSADSHGGILLGSGEVPPPGAEVLLDDPSHGTTVALDQGSVAVKGQYELTADLYPSGGWTSFVLSDNVDNSETQGGNDTGGTDSGVDGSDGGSDGSADGGGNTDTGTTTSEVKSSGSTDTGCSTPPTNTGWKFALAGLIAAAGLSRRKQ